MTVPECADGAVATVRREVESMLLETGTPGATVATFVDGELVVSAGVGVAEHNRATPIEPDARFYAYSITKTLLAIAAVQLVERGTVELDLPVHTYLPTLPLDVPVTVRQLLNHTAGLPDYGALAEYKASVRSRPGEPWTSDEFFEYAGAQNLRFRPGNGWEYSNVGYMILRLMLERVSGGRLNDVLNELVFEPLGLEETFVADSLEDASVLTPGYSRVFSDGDALADMSRIYHPGWVAHGVAISTAAELGRIFEALFAGALVSPVGLAAMLDPVIVPSEHPMFRQPAYGLGLMIDAGVLPGLLAGHTGEGPGYSVAAFHSVTPAGTRITSVAFANRDVPNLGLQMVLAAARAVAG